MKRFTCMVAMLLVTSLQACDKSEWFAPPEKEKEIVPVYVAPAKNSFQTTVDSLIKLGKLEVGSPKKVKRYPGDDVTYLEDEGYSWRGTTTSKYVQENVWYIRERYIVRETGYFYVIFHHNNHDQWLVNKVGLFTEAMFDSDEFQEEKVLSGKRVFELLDKQYSGKWDPVKEPKK